MRHRNVLQLFLIIAGCLLSLIHARAEGIDPEHVCSLTLNTDISEYPASGMKFRIYQAGIMDEFAEIIPEDGYENCYIDPEDPKKTIASLKKAASKMMPDYEAVMSSNGLLTLDGLETGVYLILGEITETDQYILEPQPMLVFLPTRNKVSEPWEYDPVMTLKCRRTEKHTELTEYSVRKVWKNDTAKTRPDNITVVISDGKQEKTVVLDGSNQWTYRWTAEKDTVFTVREKSVPAYYSSKVTGEGKDFVITNTYQRTEVPNTADMPQTEDVLKQLDMMWTLFLSGVLYYVLRKYA